MLLKWLVFLFAVITLATMALIQSVRVTEDLPLVIIHAGSLGLHVADPTTHTQWQISPTNPAWVAFEHGRVVTATWDGHIQQHSIMRGLYAARTLRFGQNMGPFSSAPHGCNLISTYSNGTSTTLLDTCTLAAQTLFDAPSWLLMWSSSGAQIAHSTDAGFFWRDLTSDASYRLASATGVSMYENVIGNDYLVIYRLLDETTMGYWLLNMATGAISDLFTQAPDIQVFPAFASADQVYYVRYTPTTDYVLMHYDINTQAHTPLFHTIDFPIHMIADAAANWVLLVLADYESGAFTALYLYTPTHGMVQLPITSSDPPHLAQSGNTVIITSNQYSGYGSEIHVQSLDTRTGNLTPVYAGANESITRITDRWILGVNHHQQPFLHHRSDGTRYIFDEMLDVQQMWAYDFYHPLTNVPVVLAVGSLLVLLGRIIIRPHVMKRLS